MDARWAYEAMQQNRMAWLAWHIAALMRQKMLPDLSRLLVGKQKPKPRQTWQEQMAIMGQWAVAMKARKS